MGATPPTERKTVITNNVKNGPLLATVPTGQDPIKAVILTTAAESEPAVAASMATESAELKAVVSKLNDHVQNISRTLSFSVEQVTGVMVIQVIDSETDELIRQIPNEQALELAVALEQQTSSLLFKVRA